MRGFHSRSFTGTAVRGTASHTSRASRDAAWPESGAALVCCRRHDLREGTRNALITGFFILENLSLALIAALQAPPLWNNRWFGRSLTSATPRGRASVDAHWDTLLLLLPLRSVLLRDRRLRFAASTPQRAILTVRRLSATRITRRDTSTVQYEARSHGERRIQPIIVFHISSYAWPDKTGLQMWRPDPKLCSRGMRAGVAIRVGLA
jgi:hypothetical protein